MGLLDVVAFGGSRKTVDPLGIGKSMKPKMPKKTAEQQAAEIRQRQALDKEIEEEEKRAKALARGQRGRGSLLGGQKTRGATSARVEISDGGADPRSPRPSGAPRAKR